MTEIIEPREVFGALQSLVGVWIGEGSGAFPTIDAFRYRERLVFEVSGIDPVMHFHQKTWLVADDTRNGELLHWESGFLMVQADGVIDLLNAQNSGRVEVLSGRISIAEDGYKQVSLQSVVHGYDDRMISTTRTFQFKQDSLAYTVGMATNNVELITQHLDCSLTRTR